MKLKFPNLIDCAPNTQENSYLIGKLYKTMNDLHLSGISSGHDTRFECDTIFLYLGSGYKLITKVLTGTKYYDYREPISKSFLLFLGPDGRVYLVYQNDALNNLYQVNKYPVGH